MERIRSHDLRTLLAVVEELERISDLDEFPGRALAAVRRLVPSDVATLNEVDPLSGRLQAVADPSGVIPPALAGQLAPYMDEHPLICHYRHTRDGAAVKLSDFLTRRQFHQLGMYHGFYRKLSIEHQMAITLPAPPPQVLGIALNRAAVDFSERDRGLLNLLRPHLVRAHVVASSVTELRVVIDAIERAEEADGRGLVILKPAGQPPMTALARRWLAQYFERPAADCLPPSLLLWVEHQRRRRSEEEPPHPARPLTIDRGADTLVVRHVRGAMPDDPDLLLLSELRATPEEPIAPADLTMREREILTRVSHGLSNVEIGASLGLSHRTVEKHLENVFRKLGVDNRTAAARAAPVTTTSAG